MLLEAWKGFEYENGDEKGISYVEGRMPKRIKKRRRIETPDGVSWDNIYMSC